jgi:glycosyltransferase involved in cell wall biosynthesis
MPPLVSVVLPVRDGGAWLTAAVDSILGQTLRDLELLVVDDHSRDAAVERLDRSDPRLQVIDSAGRGVSAAFNTGLARARGTFIARMDADDIALPHRLQRQVEYLEMHPGTAICGACVEIFAADGVRGGNRRYQDWLNACRDPATIRRELFIESPIPNPTALFRAAALRMLDGYREPDWPEDYDLFLRADAAGLSMGKPDEVLLRWREHDDRLTRTDARYALARFQAAKLHYLARHRLPPRRPVIIWGAGPTGRLTHDLLAAEGVAVAGFLDVHPRRIGGQKRGRPVWPVERLEREPSAFVLAAVGSAGARPRIRAFMARLGRDEGEDYLFVA